MVVVPWALTHTMVGNMLGEKDAWPGAFMALLCIYQDNRWAQNTKVLENQGGNEDGEVGWVSLGIHTAALARHELSSRSLVTVVSKAETSPGGFSSCGTKYKSVLEEMLLAERGRKQEPTDDLLLCSS